MRSWHSMMRSSRTAKDKAIAKALQSAVQKLSKPWYRRRALRVFRDETSLSATTFMADHRASIRWIPISDRSLLFGSRQFSVGEQGSRVMAHTQKSLRSWLVRGELQFATSQKSWLSYNCSATDQVAIAAGAETAHCASEAVRPRRSAACLLHVADSV